MKPAIILTAMTLVFSARAAEYKSGKNINVTGKYSDTIFALGRNVTADFESTDDIFVAGREINYSGRTNENLFMVGGNIVLENPRARMSAVGGRTVSIVGAEFHDLILAGGQIRINASRIIDDATITGRDIVVDPNTNIGGSLTVNGGNVVINGKAFQDAVINGNDVTLAGQFQGNVQVNGDSLKIAPNAVIQGNLSHAVRSLDISPTASILGKTVALGPTARQFPWGAVGIGAGILFMLGSLIVPALAVTLFSRTTTEGHAEIRAHFWETLGKGVVTLILIPPVIFLLFASVIGFPIGMASLPFVAAGTILAWSIAVFTVGDQLRMWLSRSETRTGRFGWTVLGAFVLAVIMAIPVVGFLFSFVLFAAGVGSIYAQAREQKRRAYQTERERPLVRASDFPNSESRPPL